MYMDKKKEREIGTFDREDKKPIPVSPLPGGEFPVSPRTYLPLWAVRRGSEGGAHLLGGFDAGVCHSITAALQLSQDYPRVVFDIFDE
jgi:hypothetical protein